ncbi:hypothetical protein ASG29_04655 [Sphingomonas sp. Leaf412]|uniref:SIMPL domain-containing protein n=1 Tax=Sphingomonas sp. Leaf412 TaxID=1736370 RepID=UPI0006F4D4C2|nr:SIMPL domain-containing protein [Sphingomonas sp. Leaf412]KQT33356.1 hypothetical protein ASG29_04655 [Sphingomonas sp. Leaf412]
MRPVSPPLLALALAAAMPAAASAQVPVPMQTVVPEGTILDVSATGKVEATPDIATIRAGVVTQAPTAAAALQDNARRMAGVVRALRGAGIAPRDLATANVSLQPQYRYADNQPPVVTGYQASNTVTVRFRDIAKAGGVLDALVTAGANQIDGPAMSLSAPEAALDAARRDAVKRAGARAELYARAAGLTIARIVSIAEAGENDGGSPRPPVMYARAVAADSAARTEVLAGETEVSATVNVRYLLK